MAQQVINNGETGGVVRGKLNDNFAELYNGIVNPYPRVANYAALPDPATVPNLIYIVETATGIWPFRRSAGMWLSTGVVWTWLANETLIAEQIVFVPEGSVSATNVQAAIVQAASSGGGSGTVLDGTATITITTPRGEFEWTQTVAAVGVLPTQVVTPSLAFGLDDDENVAEMLDIVNLSAFAGTDEITFTASFAVATSGPVKINWSAT